MRTLLNIKLQEYISNKIAVERKRVGLSQNQLSLKSELNYTYVGMIERKRYLPSIEVLAKICLVLNLSLSEFFRDYEVREKNTDKSTIS